MSKKAKIILGVSIVVGLVLITIIGLFVYYKTAFLSKEQVISIILNDIDVAEASVYFEDIDLELEEGIYDVEIYYANNKYEYKINAKTGTIIYTSYKVSTSVTTDSTTTSGTESTEETTTTDTTSSVISEDEALTIALNHAELESSDVTRVTIKQDMEHGTSVYEVEFYYNGYEYDYEIVMSTGEIISHSKER